MLKTKLVTIRASSMEVDGIYLISLHDNRDQKITVRLISRPDCPIRDMGPEDVYVLQRLDNQKQFVLKRNKNAPHFLVTESQGTRGPTQVRVTMFQRVRDHDTVQGRTGAAVAA